MPPKAVTSSATPPTHNSAKAGGVPIGERVSAVLTLAYRSGRATLLEGPTGIGKSELVRQVARQLGIGFAVLDLSLLEPPDLVGLPIISENRTQYATPSALPVGGSGILLLEELNRADRSVQQPALQLLTARRLHEYELPPGWVPFAAINPEDGEYQVTPLDPALRSRFLVLKVRADVRAWRSWAETAGVHPIICKLAKTHDDIFDITPPRTWTYASDVLHALTDADRANANLLHDALAGYLPPVWVKRVKDELDKEAEANDPTDAEVQLLLTRYDKDATLQAKLRADRDGGHTDRFHQLAKRLLEFLDGPELLRMIGNGTFNPDALDAVLADMPGDHRASAQMILGTQVALVKFLPLKPEDVVSHQYANTAKMGTVAGWLNAPNTKHRAVILANAVAVWLDSQPPADLAILKQKKATLEGLAAFARQVRGLKGHTLDETMTRHGLPGGG
jgi:MoxR-like ATPase